MKKHNIICFKFNNFKLNKTIMINNNNNKNKCRKKIAKLL